MYLGIYIPTYLCMYEKSSNNKQFHETWITQSTTSKIIITNRYLHINIKFLKLRKSENKWKKEKTYGWLISIIWFGQINILATITHWCWMCEAERGAEWTTANIHQRTFNADQHAWPADLREGFIATYIVSYIVTNECTPPDTQTPWVMMLLRVRGRLPPARRIKYNITGINVLLITSTSTAVTTRVVITEMYIYLKPLRVITIDI